MSDVSGRGVGMGALRAVVHALHGQLSVDSEAGRGTRITCTFPRSLAETGVPLASVRAALPSARPAADVSVSSEAM